MNRITPRPAQLREQATVFISDAKSIIADSFAVAEASTAFAEVYHVSLSADTVLSAFTSAKLQPRLAGARSIVLRLPLLAGSGQEAVAMVELRRFLELMCWTVYFSDHPVEWRCFEAATESGFSQDARKPISYAAHRELGYYVEYARELMNSEASGLGIAAIDGIRQVSRELNAAVHAGQVARTTTKRAPHDDISDASLRKFGNVQRRVFANCCILLAAYRRTQFDRLNAAARAHFDWLVGPRVRKQVRQGPFGLGNA